MDLTELSVKDISHLVKTGELKAKEVVNSYLNNIESMITILRHL